MHSLFFKLIAFVNFNFFACIETFFLQWAFIFGVITFYTLTSIFYMVFYTLVILFVSACFLGFFQLDLFSAFLLLIEIVVVFVSFMLIFYLLNYDNLNIINIKLFFMQYSLSTAWSFNSLPAVTISEPEFFLPSAFYTGFL